VTLISPRPGEDPQPRIRRRLSGSGLEPYLEFKAFFKGPKEKKRFGEFRL